MPGSMTNDILYSNADLPKELQDYVAQYERDEIEKIAPNIIMPEGEKKRQMQEDMITQYKRMLDEQTRRQAPTDFERLRREMHDELDDIKGAIRRMGVMLDCDIPDEEAFRKFKMLREAYRKYKMVEALILGQNND